MAVNINWLLHQLNIFNAFLYGDLDEEVYIEQPPEYVLPMESTEVCRLRKAIYELKQSPLAWFTKFSALIHQWGFWECDFEPTVFRRSSASGCVLLAVYVDDMIITRDDVAGI